MEEKEAINCVPILYRSRVSLHGSAAICDLKWIKGLLASLGVLHTDSIHLRCDSQVALHIAVFHERTKHNEVNCHFVRE